MKTKADDGKIKVYKQMKKKVLILILAMSLFFSFQKPAFAQLGTGGCGSTQIDTAIGCIDVLSNQNAFLGAILRWAVGIGGGGDGKGDLLFGK